MKQNKAYNEFFSFIFFSYSIDGKSDTRLKNLFNRVVNNNNKFKKFQQSLWDNFKCYSTDVQHSEKFDFPDIKINDYSIISIEYDIRTSEKEKPMITQHRFLLLESGELIHLETISHLEG